MRKPEWGRKAARASLMLAVAGGAMTLVLGGCGQSGALRLPEKSSLSASVPKPNPAAERVARG